MPAIHAALSAIAEQRSADPFAPVTVIAPSRLSALQLRRRLARLGAFAGVRFEPLQRIAELLAGADLALQGRRPLARPIADYVARQAALESQAPLDQVADLQGYAVALRQTFRRLRQGGFHDGSEIPALSDAGQLAEIARLYSLYSQRTAAFYDEDDLLEVAAHRLEHNTGAVLPELGDVWVLRPVTLSAAAAAFLEAVQRVVPSYHEIEEDTSRPDQRFMLAPDAASEARNVVRGVIEALDSGVSIDNVAVFYGSDRSYRGLLANAFAAANIPMADMPGTPLNETATGRAVLGLARLPLNDYDRAELFDVLGLATLRYQVPGANGPVTLHAGQWQRLAREAGVTHGIDRWRDGLALLLDDRLKQLQPDNDLSDGRRSLYQADADIVPELRSFFDALTQQLEPLRRMQPAREFVPAFCFLLDAYFEPSSDAFAEVRKEVEQLGTIDAVEGEFDLASFADALEANLTMAARRKLRLGDGVLVADHRQAGGLAFERVFICGAYEGAFPAVTESEPLLQDDVWSRLRATHPHVQDLNRRIERARLTASRLVGSAAGGVLTWSSPLQAANGTREYYPSAMMTEAARHHDPSVQTATELRRASRLWLQRAASPLASLLTGPALDAWEMRLRESVGARSNGVSIFPSHWLRPPLDLLRARRSAGFSEYDGNLAALLAQGLAIPIASVSPTALENYAACGFKYFLGSVLRLRGLEEPEDGDTIGAAERGTLVHHTLERFFSEQKRRGRPAPGERWNNTTDLDLLLSIFDEEFETLARLGRTGLKVYSEYDKHLMRADLETFLEADSDFRAETGAVPSNFELRIPETKLGDIRLSGFVDRIDRTPDGQRAYVIDYKTGRADDFKKLSADDPFAGGTKIQLPVYVLAAAEAREVQALYWFISRRGEFQRVPYDESPANRERFEQTIGAIMTGVRSGSFPAVPGEEDEFYNTHANCRYCDFTRICSRRREYEHQLKLADPGMEPWIRVSGVARGETT